MIVCGRALSTRTSPKIDWLMVAESNSIWLSVIIKNVLRYEWPYDGYDDGFGPKKLLKEYSYAD